MVTDYSDWNCLERPPPLQRKAKLRVATRINAARFPPQNELVRHSASPVKTSQKLSEFHLANSYHEQYPLVTASDRKVGRADRTRILVSEPTTAVLAVNGGARSALHR